MAWFEGFKQAPDTINGNEDALELRPAMQGFDRKTQRNEIAMTKQKITIRDETKADFAVITEVTVAAFETMEISGHTDG